MCQNKGLSIGCIIVGGKRHIGHIPELYRFLCDNKLNFKFNPLFSAGEACNNLDDIGITTDEYAEMAIELFDLWYNDNEHHIKESNFEEITETCIKSLWPRYYRESNNPKRINEENISKRVVVNNANTMIYAMEDVCTMDS